METACVRARTIRFFGGADDFIVSVKIVEGGGKRYNNRSTPSTSEHRLCWAHPQRKPRDLAESGEFEERKKKQILKTYWGFSNLYQNIREKIGNELSPYLKRKFKKIFKEITESHFLDPTPLTKIKIAFRRNTEKYFTFLKHPN